MLGFIKRQTHRDDSHLNTEESNTYSKIEVHLTDQIDFITHPHANLHVGNLFPKSSALSCCQ